MIFRIKNVFIKIDEKIVNYFWQKIREEKQIV